MQRCLKCRKKMQFAKKRNAEATIRNSFCSGCIALPTFEKWFRGHFTNMPTIGLTLDTLVNL